MAQRKIFNFPSDLLVEMTQEKEGYLPSSLGRTSSKFVFATCRYCGCPARIRLGFYNKAQSACHKECRLKEQSESGSPFADQSVQEKIRQTNTEKYGSPVASRNDTVGAKISASKLKRRVVDKKKIALEEIRAFLTTAGLTCEKSSIPNTDLLLPSIDTVISWNPSRESSELVLDSKTSRLLNMSRLESCRGLGLRLFQISERYWGSRRPQVLGFLRSLSGLNAVKIDARKCRIAVTDRGGENLLNRCHIQGSPQQISKYFNLVFDDEIVGTISASKHHRQNVSGKPTVLSRLCFENDCTVRGGASRAFKYMKEWARDEGFDRIVSWSDNMWTEGEVYKTLGFRLEQEYPPDYSYWQLEGDRYFSKQSQMKSSTGCPSEITERDWNFQRGLYRIWDCGKKLWTHDLLKDTSR